MNLQYWKSLANYTLLYFVIGFILILPFDYYLLPHIGQLLTVGIVKINTSLFGLSTGGFHSDSSMMLTTTCLLLLTSLVAAFLCNIKKRTENTLKNIHWILEQVAAYYLSLALFIYGFNKLFKYQFFFPEPNTLFTPLGQLSPDILYWSTIGTSYSYNIFAGIIEVIPALLLLFRKTRMLGATVALFVLINVMMINIGFNVEVKTYTAFLLLLCLILLAPNFTNLINFYLRNQFIPTKQEVIQSRSHSSQKMIALFRALIIGVILLESLAPYFTVMQFNGDTEPKVYMHGAYELQPNDQNVKRIFFHNKGYFILQDNNDNFADYKMQWNKDLLFLTDYQDRKSNLSLIKNADGSFRFTGILYDDIVNWNFVRIPIQNLSIYN